MNKLDELLKFTQENTTTSERISQQLEAVNKEMKESNNKKGTCL